MKKALLFVIVATMLVACGHKIPEHFWEKNELPNIYPDYTNVTVPINMAPLTFQIDGKADDVVAWLVPGSWAVSKQIHAEGLDQVLADAGFEIRQPGCSACLAMNDDKVPAGKLCISTSNRNFEGRQGPGSSTI